MKRLLFVSYYFPPSGGPGVQRTLKFVKYLPENGWAPTVLTVDPQYASYPDLDDTLAADVQAKTVWPISRKVVSSAVSTHRFLNFMLSPN